MFVANAILMFFEIVGYFKVLVIQNFQIQK